VRFPQAEIHLRNVSKQMTDKERYDMVYEQYDRDAAALTVAVHRQRAEEEVRDALYNIEFISDWITKDAETVLRDRYDMPAAFYEAGPQLDPTEWTLVGRPGNFIKLAGGFTEDEKSKWSMATPLFRPEEEDPCLFVEWKDATSEWQVVRATGKHEAIKRIITTIKNFTLGPEPEFKFKIKSQGEVDFTATRETISHSWLFENHQISRFVIRQAENAAVTHILRNSIMEMRFQLSIEPAESFGGGYAAAPINDRTL